MSGILERMAKRAHGTLAGAEPLLASKFTPAARGERDSLADLPGLHAMLPQEDIRESVFSPEAREFRQGPWQDDAGIAAARKLTSRADVSSQHLPQTASTAANSPAEHQTDSGSRGVRRGSAIPATVPSNATRALPRHLSQPNAEGPAKGADEPLVADREEHEPGAPVTPKADGQAHSAASPTQPHRGADQGDGQEANGTGVQPKPPGASRAAAAHASGTTGDARQSNAQPEEKTEIHISIGNIELRSARAETRPQPAPFRPRVTLEEFLRRGSEAQR
jgi:hypothetical protein